jgi:hypothetical protein
MAELIRGFGYDVINIDNASKQDYEFTEIIVRSSFSAETGELCRDHKLQADRDGARRKLVSGKRYGYAVGRL